MQNDFFFPRLFFPVVNFRENDERTQTTDAGKQRTGQSKTTRRLHRSITEDIDNTDEIRAIENDPTQFPNSTRIYVQGEIHPDVKVPLREIRLSDTEHPNGEVEKNDPIRVYDCSGPWGDPEFKGEVTKGLPAIRRQWILDRDDVEEYTALSLIHI